MKVTYFRKSNLFKLTLFLELNMLWSLSDNHFGDCLPKKCGKLEIQYPFHILKQQNSYCGYPGFEVTCSKDGFALFNLSGDSFVIKEIWYDDEKFQVANSAFVNGVIPSRTGCLDSLKNVSFEKDVFKFATNHNDMYVFPNCSSMVLEEYKDKRVNCGSVAFDANDPKLRNVERECNGVVKVPYSDEGEKSNRVIDGLERGMLLNWIAYNCTDCRATQGQCGFDVVNNQFNCYCSDRTHALHCTPPPVRKGTYMHIVLELGIGGVVLVLVLLALVAIWHCKKLKFHRSKSLNLSESLDRSASDVETGNIYFGVPLFSYKELLEATDNFNESKELGDGGFGTVYYGKLKDGREVAVKRLYEKSFRRVEQFMNEVQLLTRLRHQNLVSLYGCTSQHSRELLLVYEYVDNGTVADHLYGEKAKLGPLTWPVRLRIAIETANALSYLHASDIIHRDVKTNNILLDSSFKVRVADFGLSRLFPNDVTHVSTAPQGTPGYLDPEYHQFYQLTDKSDVYSFGVVLIELISSLPAIDMERHRHEINLSNYAMNRIQLCAFNELVDPRLGFDSDNKVRRMTTMVAELAFQCLQNDKEFRPTMDEVLEALNRIESNDYDALRKEERIKSNGEVLKTQGSPPPPSPVQNDHAQVLNNHQLHPPSPTSVMDKWDSKSSTHSNSK